MRAPGDRIFSAPDISVAWLLGAEGLPHLAVPDHPAVVWGDHSRSYAELRQNALSLAGSLRAAGVGVGDSVACHLFNRGEIFILYFACAYAGATLVPMNFRLTSGELEGILQDSGARLVFTESELAVTCRSAAAAIGDVEVVELEADQGGERFETMTAAVPLPGPYARHNPHIVLFSSGTTGRPKGVRLNHESIMRYASTQAVAYPGYGSSMRLLNVPAMFNTGGINEICIPTFLAGGTVYILPSRKWSASGMVELIDRWQITHTVVFPTMFSALLDLDDDAAQGMRSVEMVITGGEACPPAVMQAFRHRWPHIELVIAYGLTEGGLISLMWGDEAIAHPTSVGRSAVGSTFMIGDADRNPLPAGQIGEIWVANDAVADGYWNAPELEAEGFHDGWFKTGDLGRVDDQGFLYLEGRSRQVVISKGQNIFPAEVEAAILENPSVSDVSVLSVPDPEWGEAICAVVVARRDAALSGTDVVAWVTSRIASYKKPKHVLFRSELPVTVSNKVDKRELLESVLEELGLGPGRTPGAN